MELVNTHCHTGFCGHAEGSVQEYVDEAARAGISTLAFTDHFPLSAAFDPDDYLSVLRKDMDAYRAAVMAAREATPQMEILFGVEMDYLGALEDRAFDQAELDSFDVILGSVHFVDGWPFDDPAQRDRWDEPGAVDGIWRRYGELWCEAASDGALRFDIMSHPDLAKKFGYLPSFDLSALYDQMADAARAGGRMIELNTSGAYYACAEPFPAPDLLRAFARAGVPCTVGTDAHAPANVARDIEKGYRLMKAAGYNCVTVPARGGERRSIPLDL